MPLSLTLYINPSPPHTRGPSHTTGIPGPALAFAVAAMLRFLTPIGPQPRLHEGVFRGKMDGIDDVPTTKERGGAAAPYAGDLRADFAAGVYDFRDGDGTVPRLLYGAFVPVEAREGAC